MNTRRTVTAGLLTSGATVLLSLTACGGTSSPHAAPTVTRTVAVPVAATQSVCTQVIAWRNAGGANNLTAVATDLGQTSTDAANSDTLALMETDGPALTADASTALANPMPGNSSYTAAMYSLTQAGHALTAGDFTSGTAQLDTANVLLSKATAEIPSNC
jgi:hypothetical protein